MISQIPHSAAAFESQPLAAQLNSLPSKPKPASLRHRLPQQLSLLATLSTATTAFFHALFIIIQSIIVTIFTHPPPATPPTAPPRARVAIVGAGVTGISTAAHLVANGFEVVIFEQASAIGGIWNHVNQTSSLQLDSFMYRFHPSVIWSNRFLVKQGEILSELKRLWIDYRLESRTRFNYTVRKVHRSTNSQDGRTIWTLNDGTEGSFNALVVAVGTCGPPRRVHFQGRASFRGALVHSSRLDGLDWRGKRVVVVGGGASAVEAAELACAKGCADKAVMVSRTDKWFVPRNFWVCGLLAANPFGQVSVLDRLVERLVRRFHYGRQLRWMSPLDRPVDKPSRVERLYGSTPIVNGEFLRLVRERKAEYVRANVLRIVPQGIEVERLGTGHRELIEADIIIEATGFERPAVTFLDTPQGQLLGGPQGATQYGPPNLFMQTFVANDWSCAMTNAAYIDAVGSAGCFHIGVATRTLMAFLVEPEVAPSVDEMRKWVDETVVKKKGPLTFFTYAEYMSWFIMFLFTTNLRRLKWVLFVLFGFGTLGKNKVGDNSWGSGKKEVILSNDGDEQEVQEKLLQVPSEFKVQ